MLNFHRNCFVAFSRPFDILLADDLTPCVEEARYDPGHAEGRVVVAAIFVNSRDNLR